MNGWPPGAWRWCLLLLGLGAAGGYFAGRALELQHGIDRARVAAGIEQLLTEGRRYVD